MWLGDRLVNDVESIEADSSVLRDRGRLWFEQWFVGGRARGRLRTDRLQ